MNRLWGGALRAGDRALSWLAGVTLIAMMFLTFADVIGRYFLSAPLLGAFEVTELMLAVTTFSALPAVTFNERHITIDILDATIPKHVLRLQTMAANLVVIGMLVLLSYAVWRQGAKMSASGLRTEILHFPTYFVVYYMSALGILSAIRLAIRLVTGEERTAGELTDHG